MELNEAEKWSHEKAEYTPVALNIDHCSQCLHFITPNKCEHVKSPINSGGMCKLFDEDYGHYKRL